MQFLVLKLSIDRCHFRFDFSGSRRGIRARRARAAVVLRRKLDLISYSHGNGGEGGIRGGIW